MSFTVCTYDQICGPGFPIRRCGTGSIEVIRRDHLPGVDLNAGLPGSFQQNGMKVCAVDEVIRRSMNFDNVLKRELRDRRAVLPTNEVISVRNGLLCLAKIDPPSHQEAGAVGRDTYASSCLCNLRQTRIADHAWTMWRWVPYLGKFRCRINYDAFMPIGLKGEGGAQSSKARADYEDVLWSRALAHWYTAATFKVDLLILSCLLYSRLSQMMSYGFRCRSAMRAESAQHWLRQYYYFV